MVEILELPERAKTWRTHRYRTILADPPWHTSMFNPQIQARGCGKTKRGADRYYPLMKTPAIIELMREELCDKLHPDCHLYLWTTNNFLPDGLKVMNSLGFNYITCITWVKDKQGLGQYFRGISEQCLFGVKGKVEWRQTPDGKRAQGITAFSAPRGKHSEKPERLYQMAELVSHPPRLEMFARNERAGWDAWGNEVKGAL